MIKVERLKWLGHVFRMQEQNPYRGELYANQRVLDT
jgi:hypothetical protein